MGAPRWEELADGCMAICPHLGDGQDRMKCACVFESGLGVCEERDKSHGGTSTDYLRRALKDRQVSFSEGDREGVVSQCHGLLPPRINYIPARLA